MKTVNNSKRYVRYSSELEALISFKTLPESLMALFGVSHPSVLKRNLKIVYNNCKVGYLVKI